MLSPDNILVLAVMIGAMLFFITEKFRVDLTAMCVLVALLLLGLIKPDQALYGFAHPATATVAAMFVLSAGMVRTGLVEWLARRMDKIAGKTQTRLIFVLCITIAPISAFIINSATVAIFIPVAIALARTRKILPSRVLMPLSFASQFGGVCTLIGTSTNILVNAMIISYGLKGFDLFEFAPLGLIMSTIGILYLIGISGLLLPKRRGTYQQIDKYRLADYLAEFTVKKESLIIGKKWEKIEAKNIKDINLIKLIRDNKATWRPSATLIREGDILLVHSNAEKLIKMKDNLKLQTRAEAIIDDRKMSSDEVKLVEALVPPRSSLVGRTLLSSDFLRRFKCIVLAIQRRGKIVKERLENIHLDDGDTLLLQCDKENVDRLLNSRDLVVTNELTELHLRKNRAAIAVGLLLLVVALAAFKIVPILTAVLIGAIGMVLGRCLTLEEAYQSIDWKVIFLLGGVLPLGLALQQSGTATWLANTIMKPVIDLGPVAVLAILYLVTAVLTESMSNAAAAILLAPVAFSISSALGVSPRPFFIAITFAASTSFATPVGYQTNTMIYAPGGYRFFDFTRVGVPLNILFWITAVLFIPFLWPF